MNSTHNKNKKGHRGYKQSLAIAQQSLLCVQ